MPDLGSYANEVLAAYAASITLLLGIIVLSVVQSRRAKAALERQERHG